MSEGREPLDEWCDDYHCAGDCGLRGHGYQHKREDNMSENLTSARCSDAEFEAARQAGLLVVTTNDEAAIHAFAEAIRARETWEGLTAKEWAQRYHALQADALDIAEISRKVGDSYRAACARDIDTTTALLRKSLEDIKEIAEESDCARGNDSRMTEIRGIARFALKPAK